MARSDIRFLFRGTIQSIEGCSPQLTVLRWLRENAKTTGTKEGCAEGDCGACTVAVGTLDPAAPHGLRLMAVNSCIQLLPTLDGKALFTVEDLRGLHPVQQAMVACHGSQCGFCTPGFVMSLWTDYDNRLAATGTESDSTLPAATHTAPTREHTQNVISGNLCRCTGYRPIVDAAIKAWEYPRVSLDREPIRQALNEIAKLPALEYSHGGQSFRSPKTSDDLAALYEARPETRIVAGSTDVGLWVTKQLKNLGDIVYTGDVSDLKSIETMSGRAEAGGEPKPFSSLSIGAAVNLSDAYAALVATDPAWTELGERFASMPVRNAGTLGGNVANGSPIGDSMPPLIALGASVVLRKGGRVREIPLDDFYIDYQKTAREPGEFVAAVRVPGYKPLFAAQGSSPDRPDKLPGTFFRVWKVSKRFDQDISAVCGAFALEAPAAIRVAFGGMAAIPKRAFETEKVLGEFFGAMWGAEDERPKGSALGSGPNGLDREVEALFEKSDAAIATDFKPLSDMRATAAYRLKVAQNLVRRFVLEFQAAREGRTAGGRHASGDANAAGGVLGLSELRI